ncbi:TetR/AcrR family transcriptional regulator [Gordonia sp. NPDC003504]
MPPTGLRESKKAATRQALAHAVLALALRDGMDHVTIEAVAAEAGVSVRTFHNYFTGKEDALVSFVGDLIGQIVTRVSSRPDSETLWDSFRVVLIEIATETEDVEPEQFVTLLRLFDNEPALTAHSRHVDLLATCEDQLRAMMTARGVDPSALYPRLAFDLALTTARSALEHWMKVRDTVGADARSILDLAFDQTGSGMAQPLPSLSQPNRPRPTPEEH